MEENKETSELQRKEPSNDTKKCKYCQSDIPKKASVCPVCKKNQGSGCGTLIVTLIILGVIWGALSPAFDKQKNKNNVVDVSQDNTQEEQSESAEEQSEEETISKGQSFENNGLKVTIDDVNTDFTDYEHNEYLSPEEGKKYIQVSFTFENTNGSTDKYVSIYDFECYADNTLCEQSYNFGGDFINTNLSQGRNVSFSTYYIVPSDATSIELEYTANIWTGEKVIVKVQ